MSLLDEEEVGSLVAWRCVMDVGQYKQEETSGRTKVIRERSLETFLYNVHISSHLGISRHFAQIYLCPYILKIQNVYLSRDIPIY